MLVSSARRNVKPITRGSRAEVSSSRGMLGGFSARTRWMLQEARISPPMAPARPSRKLSVSNWRKICPRPAPRAARIPISRCRASARTRRRLATLAQAISRTKLTAPRSTEESGADFADDLLFQRATRAPQPLEGG